MGNSISIGIGIGLGSGGIFTPASLPSLTLWVKGDLGVYNVADTTPATNGQTVAQWQDLSGNGYHFTEATNKPLFVTSLLNGHAGVRFDGADDKLINATLPASAARTLFVVGRTETTPVADDTFVGYGGAAALATIIVGTPNTDFFYVYNEGGTSENIGGDPSAATVLTMNHTGTGVGGATPYINGTAGTAFDPNDAYSTQNGFFLASATAAGLIFGNVELFEIIVYNRALSASERNQVHAYLGLKYAITMA